MTAADIAEAHAALVASAEALSTGKLAIPEQMKLGERCYIAARALRYALENMRLYEQYAYTLDALADEPDCEDAASRKRLLHACANGMRQAAGIKL